MIQCQKCPTKVKSSQALNGHLRFKHSNFVPLKIKEKRAERILIGNQVVTIDDLKIELDSAVRLKQLSIKSGWSTEETVDYLIEFHNKYLGLLRKTSVFVYTKCINCGGTFWMPNRYHWGNNTAYCSWCAYGQVWKSEE